MENSCPFTEIEIPNRQFSINGTPVEKPQSDCYPWKYIEYNGRILVLFWPESGKILNSNVYAFDTDGRLLWKVEPIVTDGPNASNDSYVYFAWNPKLSRVVLISWLDTHVMLDDTTGKIYPLPTYI